MEILIEPSALQEIHVIGEKDYPYEACGFLFGTSAEGVAHITQVQEVVNDSVENKKVHYTIPPKAFMKAEHYALENNLQIIGVFHSHPDHPPRPSGRDLADALPELSYFITSVFEKRAMDTRSWRLSDSRNFMEEAIEINYKNKLSK